MPAYGQTLPRAALQRVLDYVRGFCTNPAWPRGELNLPRALVTEKAYPENEAVVTVGTSDGHVSTEFLYEQRLGARSQFEVAVPFSVQRGDARSWDRGLGDVAVAVKHALFHSRQAGTIFSAAGEVVLPTGKEDRGFGKGVTVFEPFVALGQILPADSFVQVQSGFELSTNRDRAGHEAFFRTALGKTFTEPRFGRAWSPMVEFLAGRELSDGESTAWDIVPQLQVSLSQRQHILLNAGVRVPLTSRGERDVQVLAYFLWDWFDGGLLEGW
jgi:hypothetical protein